MILANFFCYFFVNNLDWLLGIYKLLKSIVRSHS